MVKWWIGCSGFHYKHWKGVFYPGDLPATKWFPYYCGQFNTVELNVTFYRFPQLSTMEGWYNASPKKFKFSVKAPRAITHFKQFYNCEQLLTEFYDTVSLGLKEKLGCILFQLPPRFAFKEENLLRIIENMDPAFQNILEFRNPGWWNQEVYQKLHKHNIGFSGMSHPTLPSDIIQTIPAIYYRMHGSVALYKSLYELKDLENIVQTIKSNKKIKEAYIYFNNDIDGSAVINAKQMIALTDS